MSELKHGSISVSLPEWVKLSERAGKMSKQEVSRLLKAPHGMELVVEHTARALETAGASFSAPPGVTPESLRASGTKESGELEVIIGDLLLLLLRLKQGKLLIDHETHLQLLKLKDAVRTQAKYNSELKSMFASLLELFDRSSERRKENRAKAQKATHEEAVPSPQAAAHVAERPSLNLVKLAAVSTET